MKHVIFIIGFIGFIVSCNYEKPGYYEANSYVAMWREVVGADSGKQVFGPSKINSKPLTSSFYSINLSSSNTMDTAWFKVQAFGLTSAKSRRVMIEQYSVDRETEEGINIPVAGVNFVPLDDASLAEFMLVPQDSSVVHIPVVLKYNPASAGKQFKLYFHLVPTEDFDVTTFTECRGCVSFKNN